MKPSALLILEYLRRQRDWVSTVQIIRNCPTTTPSKRLSELHQAGLIDKKRDEVYSHFMLYRAKEVQNA